MAPGGSPVRRVARRLRLRQLPRLMLWPPAVARFQWRAWGWAQRHGDAFSLVSATQPRALRTLLRLARPARHVVELGTGTGWTAISLALGRRDREVVSYDPVLRPEREAYLRLAGSARARIRLLTAPGDRGPDSERRVDLLFVDSAHDRESVLREYRAWRAAMAPGGLIVFDDYGHPDFPGVRQAIEDLALAGEPHGTLFVHRVPEG